MVQFALALPLVVCALLLARSIGNLRQVALGYETAGVALVRVDATRNDYSRTRVVATYRNVLAAVRAVPGVRTASASMSAPLTGSRSSNSFRVEGVDGPAYEGPNVEVMYVDPEYFLTLGVGLRAGREFTVADDPRRRGVAVVSESFARRLMGTPSHAVGRRMARSNDTTGRFDIEIVGVVPDARLQSPRAPGGDVIYQPFLADSGNVRSAMLLVSLSRPLRAVEPALRQAMAAVDAQLEVLDVRAFSDQVDAMLAVERMVTRLTMLFGVLAVALAALGVYGVFAHDVVRRSHEIGVRLALGASPGGIRAWLLRRALGVLAAGLVLGVPLALGATRAARALLYDVGPGDPLSIVGAAAVLVCTLAVAVWVPSQRAARTDPLTTLRAG